MAEEELAAVAALRRGRVRLAAFPSASATLVPQALARLSQSSPGIDVALTEAEPPEALALLADGQVDLALVFGYREAPVPTRPSCPGCRSAGSRSGWCCRPAGPGRASVDLDRLADEPWIAGCDRCRAHLVHLCEQTGFVPHHPARHRRLRRGAEPGRGRSRRRPAPPLRPRGVPPPRGRHPAAAARLAPSPRRHPPGRRRTVPAVRALLEALLGERRPRWQSVPGVTRNLTARRLSVTQCATW